MPPVSGEPRTVQLPQLSLRAEIAPTSLNKDQRTVDLIFSTGADVVRSDWWTGQKWIERLSLDKKAVRLERLNSGAPLLDTHSGWSLGSMLGVVREGTAKIEGKKGIAGVQFSRRDDVAPIWQDVEDGIIRNVSVGYVVHAYEETPAKRAGDLPIRTAVDWEPYEISLVPMPADAGAQVRDGKSQLQTFPCRISVRAADATQERTMTPNDANTPETVVDSNPLAIRASETGAVETPAATDAELATRAERTRVQGIDLACRTARMTQEFRDKLVTEGVSLTDAQTRVFEEMRKRGGESVPTRSQNRVEMGEDPFVHVRAGVENAILHRIAPAHFKLDDKGRKYRGMTMLDVARSFLAARYGAAVHEMSRADIAGAALGLVAIRSGGMHTTSDFANLLENIQGKTLRAAYEEQPQTFRPLVRIVTLVDFKPVSRVQLGDAPALLEIGENGEYKSGTVSDGKVSYQLASYGRKFAITRKALINDDTDAFSRVPMMFGRKARVLESNLVWGQITGNAAMPDGDTLFHANHGNLAPVGSEISVEALGEMRAALRQQTSIDGDYMNLAAAYLLVPTALETEADKFVTVVTPQNAGNVNPFQNKLTVIADPRLDADDPQAWYGAANVQNVDIIELGYLEGEEGPRIESRVSFDVDGIETKCGIDVVAKVIDHRGLFKNPGAAT